MSEDVLNDNSPVGGTEGAEPSSDRLGEESVTPDGDSSPSVSAVTPAEGEPEHTEQPAIPLKKKKDSSDQRASFRERAWQMYSEATWKVILESIQNGTLEANVDLAWMGKMLSQKPEVQEYLFGKSFPAQRTRLLTYQAAAGFILFVVGGCLWCSLDLYGVLAFAVIAFFFSSAFNKTAIRPKGPGMIVYYFLLVAIAVWHFMGNLYLQAAALFTAFLFLMPYLSNWYVLDFCREYLATDYAFFREVTGRPEGNSERPPVTFVSRGDGKTSIGNKTIPWDVGKSPALLEYQYACSFPVLYGTNQDFYFSVSDTRMVAMIFAAYGMYRFPRGASLAGYVLVVSLLLSLIYAYVCPSQQYKDYVEKQLKKNKDANPSSLSLNWCLINSVRTFVCIGIMAFVFSFVVEQLTDVKPEAVATDGSALKPKPTPSLSPSLKK